MIATRSFDLTPQASEYARTYRIGSIFAALVSAAFLLLGIWSLFRPLGTDQPSSSVALIAFAASAVFGWFAFAGISPLYTDLTIDPEGIHLFHRGRPWRNRTLRWDSPTFYLYLIQGSYPLFKGVRMPGPRVVWAMLSPLQGTSARIAMPPMVAHELIESAKQRRMVVDVTEHHEPTGGADWIQTVVRPHPRGQV